MNMKNSLKNFQYFEIIEELIANSVDSDEFFWKEIQDAIQAHLEQNPSMN